MKSDLVRLDGLAILDASTLTGPVKSIYCRGWMAWEDWCRVEGVELASATEGNLFCFVRFMPGLTPPLLLAFYYAVVRVYQDWGRKNFGRSPELIAVRDELKARVLNPYPALPVCAKTARTHQRWVNRFLSWCRLHGKQALPADSEDVADFLRGYVGLYSSYEIRMASAGISRYQRDHGFTGTSRRKSVLAVVAEAKRRGAEGVKPEGAGSSAAYLRIKELAGLRWSQWCLEKGLDEDRPCSADILAYWTERKDVESPDKMLFMLAEISARSWSGGDPTESDEVKALAADLTKQRLARQQRSALGCLLENEGQGPRRKRSGAGEEVLDPRVLELLCWKDEEMPAELSEEYVEWILRARAASKAVATLNGYLHNGWDPYVAWCQGLGISVWDAQHQHVEAYICLLAETLLPDVVRIRLNGIKYFYSFLRQSDNPAAHPMVDLALAGLKRKNPKPARQADPIRHFEYVRIAEVAQLPRPGETERAAIVRGAFDIALIGCMRDGLLRLDEAWKARWRYLARQRDGTGLLTIPTSKTDPEGKGDLVYVSRSSMDAIDVMRQIRVSLGFDIKADDRIFPLGKERLRARIAKACAAAGLVGNYSGHSCRVGMAQDLAVAGFTDVEIMQAGRWTSISSVARYIRHLRVLDGAVARWSDRRAGALGLV